MTVGCCLCESTLPSTAQTRARSRFVLQVQLPQAQSWSRRCPSVLLSSCDVMTACRGVGLSSPFSLFSREKSEDSHVQRNLTGAPANLRLSRLSNLISSGRNISSSAFTLLTLPLCPLAVLYLTKGHCLCCLVSVDSKLDYTHCA